ncbi:thiol:disulfide interchange protein [Aquipluma nitroreducens]|uniref:Thiol:disulfide interchange protein n=1 Tax=Aquipluma nitroreducens TaxID=2010828 RepID=A0A5K7S7Q1_9BACT|nr:TlpA disulfide reductase family protein [Aquipluma nitroreducens]BBE17582.1 thiol:disulfide interchange protein [Aquipluma nitroreducens]
MKKIIVILLLSAICGMTNGQLLTRNANKYAQLKIIADKLNTITSYQSDCDLVITSSEQGTLHSASTLIVQKVPTDTLCGFYYYFKTDEQYKKNNNDFIAFFNNAFYLSKNNAINKYTLFDYPKRFKDTKFDNGYSPAIHRSSLYFTVTPKELSEFIDKSIIDNEKIIEQKPDTLIGGKNCIKYVIKASKLAYLLSTELCFEKEQLFPLYYRHKLISGMSSQSVIATFSNTKVDFQLPASYFSEESLFGRKLEKNTKEIKYKQLKIGEVAPDWELPILGKMIKLSSKELLGKYIMLEFTGTWCPHCWDAVKMMNRLENEFNGNNKLSILSVFSTDIDNEEKITKFANEQKIKSTILHSAKTVGDKYYVVGYPSFFIIDPTGKLVLTIAGYSQDIENEIANYLKDNLK